MRIDTPTFSAGRTSKTKEYRFVVGIIFDVDSIYITSHGDISGVPGTVIQGCLQQPVITSQRLIPDQARAEIGSASFNILDKASQFTDEVRERLNDGAGLRYKEVRFYAGFAGNTFSQLMRVGTQLVTGADYINGQYLIECADIQRAMRKDIFVQKLTTLASTLTAGDSTITLTDASAFTMVFHGASYSDAPNTTVGYVKIKNTIYRYTGKTGNQLTGATPVFGTVAETITVDPAVAADRREKVEEYIYLELPAVKLALALLTGDLYNDGHTLPAHWHMGVDSRWITEEDFTGIGRDLWNTSTDSSPNSGYVMRFEGLSKTDGKTFLEKEIYLLLGVFSPVYADGSVGLKRMARIGEDAAHVAVLDNKNSISVGNLNHDMKSVHNVFRVNWSWNGERFNRVNEYFDVDSRLTHGDSDLYERGFKGLHGSIHTDAAVFQQLNMIRDRYAGPPQNISVQLLDSMNNLEVGDVVRGRWPHVRDFAGGGTSIDRAFEIQNISCDFRTGVSVELFGSTALADIQSPTSPSTSLPDGFYTSQGTNLSSAPGITISGGVLTAATQTLNGNADLGNAGAIYYYAGNLTIASGVTLNIGANVQLRVRGFLTVNGTINGIGRGHAGVADGGQPLAVTYTLEQYIADTIIADTIPGTPGYVGSSRGYDGVYTSGNTSNYKNLGTRPSAFTPSVHGVAPVLSLQVSGSSLIGLPTDLRGTGGAPGGRAGNDATNPVNAANRGGPGAAGGAGLLIICRGMALGVNGIIDLSGADSTATSIVSVSGTNIYPGAGGAGGPGTCYVLLDGSALSVPDFGIRFRAYTGEVPRQGNPLAGRGQNGTGSSYVGANPALPPIAGYADPAVISDMNLSGAALRIQYVPASETPQVDQDSRPPPPSGLSAVGVVGGIYITITAPPPEQWDVIEIYGADTNDRTGATLVSRSRSTAFTHGFATVTTKYYWARTRADGRTSDWYPSGSTSGASATSVAAGSGAPGESVEVQFAQTAGGTWHSTFTVGDLYMRTRVGSGGAWQGPWRVVGEEGADGTPGADGNITSFIFRRSATQPATPTGNSPSGWTDSPVASDGNPLWVSRAQKTPAGILVGSWSVPTILVVDGEDGEDGLPGIQGPGLFDWVNPINVSTTATSVTRNAGTGAWNAGVHSLQSFSDGSFFTFQVGQTNLIKAAGFNDDPAADANYTGITRGFLFLQDGTWRIITDGVQSASQGAYLTSDVWGGVHDGETIRLYKNGVEVGTSLDFAGRLFFDTSFFHLNASFINIHWGASGVRGPEGPEGQPAASLRLTTSSQMFVFPASGGTPTPASITLTAVRQNIATATVWSATPNVTLTGSGDTRTLTAANFGSNNSVKIRGESSGFFDEITIIRVTQGTPGANGEPALGAYLTNESHAIPADSDGVVAAGAYAQANGYFVVYSGAEDVSTQAAFSLVSSQGCTVQINTAVNTPVNGQPKGFYRVTAITADTAYAEFQAAYSGATIVKRFSLVRSRAGAPGDGQNLLPINDWVVGTTGAQGPGGRWNPNGPAAESAIVLGGATANTPVGPYGTSEPLWECRPTGTGSDGDGGWTIDVSIDHRRTYRSTVWFRVNQLTGNFYHGPTTAGATTNLTGGVNPNPYFAEHTFANLGVAGLQANKWYLSVGIIHGSGYTGGHSGISGIYEPETGRRIATGYEFKNTVGATTQAHRCYHFYDPSSAARQWMPKPRFEEMNGGEPSIDSLLGFNRSTPWMVTGNAFASLRTFFRSSGPASWFDSYVYSVVGYADFHLQFKAGQADRYFIIGVTPTPGSTTGTTFPHQIYCRSDGIAEIYENSVAIASLGSYTAQTVFGIARRGSNIEYYKDGVLSTTRPSLFNSAAYLFCSLYNQFIKVNAVAFGPGTDFEVIDTSELTPGSATEVVNAFAGGGVLTYGQINGAINDTRSPLSCAYINTRNESVLIDVSYKGLLSITGTEPSGISRYVYLKVQTYDTATVTDFLEIYTEDTQGGYFSDCVLPRGFARSGSIQLLLPPNRTVVANVYVSLRAQANIYPNVPDTHIRDRALSITAMKR